MNKQELKQTLIELSKESEQSHPIDWSTINLTRDSVYSQVADHIIDMYIKTMAKESKDTQILILLSSVLRYACETFVFEVNRLQNQDDLK